MADFNISGLTDEQVIAIRAILLGASEVTAEAAKVDTAIESMGVASETAGRRMEGASRRSFLMGQAMFTLRRFIYQGTLALVAAGGAAAYFGLQFDSNMQQSTVALTHFLGSTAAAHKELAQLYHLAAYTPFSFQDVTEASKSMLSFGFSTRQTNYYLKVMADTMSGLGLSGQSVQQFTNDIVKMAARGKLMGQDIRELVSLHIPALKILQQQLGLTQQQIEQIGAAGIPAQTAIDALFKGLEANYKNMAEKQSRTLLGRLSTLKDLTQQMLGIAMQPLFNWLQDTALPVVNEIIGALARGFGRGGLLGSLREINRSNAPFWFKTLYTTVVRTVETVTNLYNAFKPLFVIIGIFAFGTLYALNTGMGLFNRHATIGTGILWALVAVWVVYNWATWTAALRAKAIIFWTNLIIIRMAIQQALMWGMVAVFGEANAMMIINAAITAIRTGLVWAAVAATVAWSVATAVLNGEMALLDALMYANPIGLIILAVLALAAGFYLLWTRSGTFREIIKGIGSVALTVFGYMVKVIEWIIDKIEWIARKVEAIPGFHLAMEVGSFLADTGNSVAGSVGAGIGGGNANAGRFAGAYNTTHPGQLGGTDGGGGLTTHVHVHIDRKQVGEAVAHYNADKKARR